MLEKWQTKLFPSTFRIHRILANLKVSRYQFRLVQALVAGKDALFTLTNALAGALGPLIQGHASDQSDKDSESGNYTDPGEPVASQA